MGPTKLGCAIMCAVLAASPLAAAQEPVPEVQGEPAAEPKSEPRVEPATAPQDGSTAAQTEPVPQPPAPAEPPAGWFQNFNPQITLFGDILARTSVGNNDLIVIGDEDEDGDGNPDPINVDDRVSPREFELALQAAMNELARGVFIVAFAEHHPNEFEVEIEEAYLQLRAPAEDPWTAGMSAKAGRFRTALGRQNSFHTHDLPQPTRPWATAAFLGDEGMRDTGLSLEWEWPEIGPWIVTMTLEGVNGEDEILLAGGDQDFPAGIASLRGDAYLGPIRFEIGVSGLLGYRNEARTRRAKLGVVDFMLRWQPDPNDTDWSVVIGAEGYASELDDLAPGHRAVKSAGGYLFAQVQMWHEWYLGVRGDWTRDPVANRQRMSAWSVYAGWHPIELLRFRLGFEHAQRPGDADLHTLFFGITFAIGAHPPHPHLHAHPHK